MQGDSRAEAAPYSDANPTIPDDLAFYTARLRRQTPWSTSDGTHRGVGRCAGDIAASHPRLLPIGPARADQPVYQDWGAQRQTCLVHLIRSARGLSEKRHPELAVCGRRGMLGFVPLLHDRRKAARSGSTGHPCCVDPRGTALYYWRYTHRDCQRCIGLNSFPSALVVPCHVFPARTSRWKH